MQYNYDYFISYAHNDNKLPDGVPGFVNEFVEKLKNGSEEHKRIFGGKIRIFFDETEIPDMSHWDNKIRAGLASSRFLIVLLSPNYFKSEYCAKEFDWWMKHEMHRCTLGEGTAPMIISNVGVFDPAITPAPEIPADIQLRFPNWLSQIQAYQSKNFDMHDFLIAEIDNVLKTLREKVKDKVRHQEIVDGLPYDTYPGYNENFVGRRENLLSLRNYITTKSGKVITALTGVGGFGKTELALTYGHAFGWDYQLGRFFKSCENCNSIYDALLSCGIQTKYGWEPKGTDEQQLLTIFNNLKVEQNRIILQNEETGNLRTEGAHMLLILDNVNNLDLITQLQGLNLPDFIHVIITTRENTNAFDGIYSESVERLSEDESVELLNNLRLFANPAEAEAARKIAKLLAGFTLIVELTGKYLYQNRKNPDVTYQTQYERLFNNHAETFEKMADKVGDLTRHAAETVSAVMESTLAAISPNTRKALNFASLMAPDAVAFGWLPELLGLDEDDGWEALDELTGYSLLTPLENEPNIARIHRLVAETVKQEIPEDVQKEIIAKIRKKCEALLHKDKTFWCTPENSWNITPVSEFCLALTEQKAVETSDEKIHWTFMDIWNFTDMLENSGLMLISLGKINEARKVFKRHLEISEEGIKLSSSSITRRALSMSYLELGDLERVAGNVAVARDYFEKSLENWQQLPESDWKLQGLGPLYNRLGGLEETAGNAAAAREWYEKSLEILKRVADKTPDDNYTQRVLSISYNRLGNLERAAGNAAAAREWYEKALEIAKRLAEQMPDNVDAQRDLSISYERLGDLERDAGNAAGAREWYKKALEIYEKLAKAMPENVDAQRAPSVIYNRLGDLENAAGNAAAARNWYEKALEIRKRLAEQMPNNVQAQRDLSHSYNRLGDLEQAAGNTAAARNWYEKALEISKRLAEQMPDNVDAQQNLSYSYNKLGKLEESAGNAAAAREWYEKALEIAKRLAEQMPDNVQAQRDLSVSYERFGDVEKDSGNTNSAREWYEKALEISKRLAEQMSGNVQAQRDLSECFNDLGNLEIVANNAAAAKEWSIKALQILEPLVEQTPDDVRSQMVLGNVYRCLGDSEAASRNIQAAMEWYKKALEIFQRLVDKSPENAEYQKALAETQEKISQAKKQPWYVVLFNKLFRRG
ncbi:MAG: DUF2225 domain-containing protein [Thermoguttaceae bacterium]|nr:DUF2225 domain-containing protein [Thermoguttaceae bacterium]